MTSITMLSVVYKELNPLGTKGYLASLECSDMPWHLYFFSCL